MKRNGSGEDLLDSHRVPKCYQYIISKKTNGRREKGKEKPFHSAVPS